MQSFKPLYGFCCNQHFFLSRYLKEEHLLTYNTTPKDISKLVKEKLGETVSYPTSWKTKQTIRDDVLGGKNATFAFFDSFCDFIKINGGYSEFYITDEGHFNSVFIAPKPCIDGIHYIRPYYVLDGAFCKTEHGGQLFVAVAFDNMDRLFPLCFGIVDRSRKYRKLDMVLKLLSGRLQV